MRAVVVIIALSACGKIAEHSLPDAEAIDAAVPIDGPVGPSCAPTPAGLRARWRGEMTAADDTGTFNGSDVGAATYTSGRHGFAFLFDGTDNAVVADETDELWPAASFSLEAWVNTATPGTIMEKYQCGNVCPGGAANAYWFLGVGGGGAATFEFRADAATDILTIGDSLHDVADQHWHHLVGERDIDAKSMVLYVDGVLAVSAPLPDIALGPLSDVDHSPDPITFGAQAIAGQVGLDGFRAGAFDELAYYATALTADEVAAIFAAPDGECN